MDIVDAARITVSLLEVKKTSMKVTPYLMEQDGCPVGYFITIAEAQCFLDSLNSLVTLAEFSARNGAQEDFLTEILKPITRLQKIIDEA